MASEVCYFVSDTHLGDGSGADRFRYPHELNELLDRVAAEPKARLVLLGDFLELWASSLEGILVHHAPLFTRLGSIAQRHPITYVVGNHDSLPLYALLGSQLGPVQICERFTAARGALVALHGHQYDPFNRVNVTDDGHVKAPWIRRLVQMIGVLGRVGGEQVANLIAGAGDRLATAAISLDQLIPDWEDGAHQALRELLQRTQSVVDHESPGERGYPRGEPRYEEAARALLRDGAQFVLMGHTHHPEVRQYGRRLYVNTGSWVWDRYPPTYARWADGALTLLNAQTHAPYEPPRQQGSYQ